MGASLWDAWLWERGRKILRGAVVAAMLAAGPAIAGTSDTRLDTLVRDIEAHHGRLHADDIEKAGQAALNDTGDRQFFALWRVLYYYRDNSDNGAFARWLGTVDTWGRTHDQPRLRALSALMRIGEHEGGNTPSSAWEPYLNYPDDGVRAAAWVERITDEAMRGNGAAAVKAGSTALGLLEPKGRVAYPMAAVANSLLADTLDGLGDHESALDHLMTATEIDRKIGTLTPDAERVYDLTDMETDAGHWDAAERLWRLHGRLIASSGGPNAVFNNRYLCAGIAYGRKDYARILDCLRDVAAKVEDPGIANSERALEFRARAYGEFGRAAEAEADLKRLKPRLAADTYERDALRIQAALEHHAGQDGRAYNDLLAWHDKVFDATAAYYGGQLAGFARMQGAELELKRSESARLRRQAELQQQLSLVWGLAAALFAGLCLAGAGWVLHLRRVTRDLKLARARAESANAAKSAFLSVISHELRTPLTGILGMARAMTHGRLDKGQSDAVHTLLESGGDMLTLLNDLLDTAKIEAGKLEIVPAVADLRDISARTVRLYQAGADEKGVVLTLKVADALPSSLIFDALRVRQCLANLISNAVKFTPRGQVAVAIDGVPSGDGWQVSITVRDAGIGMGPQALSRLFSSFTQADATISGTYGGTGLGLSITRTLAEMMGGGVTAESVEGEGSTFVMTFFARIPEAAVEISDAGRAQGAIADMAGLRVLVVDDHPINRKVVRTILMPLGCEIVEAEGGRAALRSLKAAAFDVVLMDINMPDLDGLETARLVRADPTLRGMPIIALTADVTADRTACAKAAGMAACVAKPIDAVHLLSAMTVVLETQPVNAEPVSEPG